MRRPVARHGQPIAILELFLSLAAGAVLLLLFRRILTPILQQGEDRATDQQVLQANDWFTQLINNMELVFVLVGIFGLLVLAVFRSQVAS